MENIESWWRSFYGSAPPVAHLLREEIPDRWMRIHSLPESKRYPETTNEYSILLARHNKIAAEVLGSQSPFILFAGQYVQGPETEIQHENYPGFETADFKLFKTMEEYDPLLSPEWGTDILNIWYRAITWSSGRFDEIIKAVADDQVRHIMFASLETGEAYAPYDGGADLFLNSTNRRTELKHRYKDWLSIHSEGL